MKTNSLALWSIALLMFALSACGSAGEFTAVKNLEGVDVIHLPRGVMAMAGAASLSSGDKEFSRVAKGVKSLDVVSCTNSKSRRKVMDCTQKALKASESELLMDVCEKNERTAIYGRCNDKSVKVSDVYIVTSTPGDLSVIRAKGSFDISDLLNSDSSSIKFFYKGSDTDKN